MTIREIENAIENLPASDLASFRQWFAEFDAANWDKQFEAEVAAGCLGYLVEEAGRDR